ncbi:flagellar basal body P-ring formation chaperone FlgA [Gemmatimonas sp.]|jgi:flagella basal body P-ring formation protein FlgA|uniref:flagellar basal body P-ring formation chaperone FlgA n=1 Tax=Gemmatimonas sp. TaxID=1962908 RepID=UPI0037C03BB3
MRPLAFRPSTVVVSYLCSLFAAVVVSLLLPLALRAQATPVTTALRNDQRRVSVTVATRAIVRGETLLATDIAVADTVITWRWNGMTPDTTRAQAGWVAQRAIAAGEVLRAPAVTPPPVITSGSAVKAIWQDGPLTLVMSGVATNTAALGAPVGIRIDRTRRLDGIAVAPNTVRLR